MARVNVTEKSLINLRFAVLKKYGRLYGVLKKEVDIALQERAKILLEENNAK